MGCPNLVIVTADNQRAGVEVFAREGAIVTLGLSDTVTERTISSKLSELLVLSDKRNTLAQRARSSVDGLGLFRIVEAMQGLVG